MDKKLKIGQDNEKVNYKYGSHGRSGCKAKRKKNRWM
jgi:hypothetical protein